MVYTYTLYIADYGILSAVIRIIVNIRGNSHALFLIIMVSGGERGGGEGEMDGWGGGGGGDGWLVVYQSPLLVNTLRF